jgi:hypothetical protein
MRLTIAKAGLTLALGSAFLAASCSSGSGGGSSAAADKLAVVSINVLEGQEWQINRAIDILFNQAIDFATVNLNTINIVDEHGNGATGIFSQPSGNGLSGKSMVRFQPTCPTLADNSDAGLLPNGVYQLTVRGSKVGGTTVLSTAGEPLEEGALRTFTTPDSEDPQVLFVDTTAGPPVVIVRQLNDNPDLPATSLILGGIEQEFLWSTLNQQARLPFEVPLNHYSIPENQIEVIIQFNQPVLASPENINSDMIRLRYFDVAADDFLDMQTEVELIENCTESGAAVRVSPLGIVPQDALLVVELRQGFKDLIGDSTSADVSNFSVMQTVEAGQANPLHPTVDNPEVDDIFEGFDLSGNELGSLEDTGASFGVPAADWGGGSLEASFAFGGTGGPGGDFDWHIPPATELVLDTVSDTIQGGPGGTPTTTQAVINGIVDVRDVFIPATSTLRIVGPNTCTILASGSVRIEGEITINGSDSPGVGTLDTTNQPEVGAKGNGGGGDGGTGSFLTTQSTPRGGRGFGAFNVSNLGGQGGEASYATITKDARRGAGGGGGNLGPSIYHLFADGETVMTRVQARVGFDGEPGAPGGLEGFGAVSQDKRAQGGLIGPSPFLDNNPDNNFLGTMITSDGVVIMGELNGVHAGAGGGAGGDAVKSDSFPLVPFTSIGDEKGAGGGGGAGGLRILAIGPITIGGEVGSAPARISADGGDGGGGENTNFFDRVGGGSGGGSGGHLVFSSAARIDIYGVADASLGTGFWYRDDPTEPKHALRPISAMGGQGGAGNNSEGGANQLGPSTWRCDSIPTFYDEGLVGVPPFKPKADFFCFWAQQDQGDPSGFWSLAAGGDGQPGIIQFHVDDPANNLEFHDVPDQVFDYSQGQDISQAISPPPLGWKAPETPPDRMVPFFGRLSQAQSKWIPLGLGRLVPGGGNDLVNLTFAGTNTADGIVPGDGSGAVSPLPPLLGPQVVTSPTFSMTLDASGLGAGDELYTENSRLLKGFTVKLEDSSDVTNFVNYVIVSATYDSVGDTFSLGLDPNGENPAAFQAGGSIQAYLVPYFVRVITNAIADSYPEETSVRVRFDATTIDTVLGGPSESSAFGFTPDIADLNAGDVWDFVRFDVEFDIDKSADGIDITTPRPGIDHLRVHFDF